MGRVKAHYRGLYGQSLRFLRQVCNGSILHQGSKNIIKDFGCTLQSIVCLIKKKNKKISALFCCLVLQAFKESVCRFKIFHLRSQSCRETKNCRTLLSRNAPWLNATAISDTLSTEFWHNKFCSGLHLSNTAETQDMQQGTGLALCQRAKIQF